MIFEGQGRRPVAPPAAVTDRDGWYRDFIARTCLPAPLAEFFLFDGEQVQRYASRGMSSQVKLGVEGLLGLPVLKSLTESLQKYAPFASKTTYPLAYEHHQMQQNRLKVDAIQLLVQPLGQNDHLRLSPLSHP